MPFARGERYRRRPMTSLTLALLLTAAPAEKPRLALIELTAQGGVEASAARSLTDAIAAELQARGYFEVISQRDIETLLGLERQRQLLGCADDGSSCLSELSAALGARFVLSGSLSQLGTAWQLTLSTFDTQRGQALGRSTRVAFSLEVLRASLALQVAEATATPPPAPPSKVLPVSLMAAGGASALFGLVWGTLQLSAEQQLAAELDRGATTPGRLRLLSDYEADLRLLRTQQFIALGALLAGAGLVTAGVLLLPKDSNVQAALVPFSAGLTVVGSFP